MKNKALLDAVSGLGCMQCGSRPLSQNLYSPDDPANAIINLIWDGAMRADAANCLASAEYDLETPQHMLAAGRYLYVVFMCHLALEKMLKAHKDHLEFIGGINNASILTRYPDDIERVLGEYSEPVAHEYFEKTTE